MNRRETIIALVALGAVPLSAEAQQAAKVPRIGYLSSNLAGTPYMTEGFRQGLRDLGYFEGRNVVIEFRDAEGKLERLPALAAELVALKVDVIVVGGSGCRPGSQVPWAERTEKDLRKEAEVAARALGVRLQFVEVRGPDDFDRAFSDMTKARAGALTVLGTTMLINERRRLVELAAKNRLPAMYGLREYVDAGGLMCYGPNNAEMFRRAATYVDKILKGAKPADLPVEQPTKFELVINLKTAKALGLTIPPSLLQGAEVIQ